MMKKEDILLRMQEGMEDEEHPLYLSYTGWTIDGQEVSEEMAEQLEDEGYIEFVQWVGGTSAQMYFLTEKGKNFKA